MIDTASINRSPLHRRFLEFAADKKRAPRFCRAGDQVQMSRDVTARVLFPPENFQADRADDQALVIEILLAGRRRVLLMSDSGEATEN